MNVKHTPGPWSLRIMYSRGGYTAFELTGVSDYGRDWDKSFKSFRIGIVQLNDHYQHSLQLDEEGINPFNVSPLDNEANAKLIAAAPELLEVLIKVNSAIQNSNMNGSMLQNEIWQAIKSATE